MFINRINSINYSTYNPRKDKKSSAVTNIPHFKGYNQNQASLFSPWLSSELYKIRDPEIFNKIKMFKNLNQDEKYHCYEDIINFVTGSGCFFTTLLGYKPACLLEGKNNPLAYLDHINYNIPVDIVHAGLSFNPEYYNTYLLNREKTLEIVKQNKLIFTRRLGLSDNTSTDEIYSRLQQILATNAPSINDLEGIIFGFPKYNAMIFKLDSIANVNYLRDDMGFYRAKLIDNLYSENSPYKNLPKEEFKKLEELIQISYVHNYKKNPYFQYVKFVEEPEAEEKLFQKARNFNGEFSAEQLF